MQRIIDKYDKQLNIAYIIILALYPMLRVSEGLSVMDTTYSLSNYAFFGDTSGTWMVATFLANVLGSAFMHLPFGTTILGMNIYTSLLIGLTAVSAFLFMRNEMPKHILFLAQILALNLCWCPSVILYNYLTYFLFTLGALFLYKGVCGAERDNFVAAGILLGLNVGTRFPNVTEMALIVVLWYGAFVLRKSFIQVLRETFLCIVGYIVGFLVPYIIIMIRYTSDAYSDMINTLFAMTDKATDYKPTSMITAMFADYIYARKWIALFVLGTMCCIAIWYIAHKLCKARAAIYACGLSGLVLLAVIRICFGQGMFSFRYYEYSSMYFWAVMFIGAGTIISLVYFFKPIPSQEDVVRESDELTRKKIFGFTALCVTYITCLGSNNGLYPIVNNLFIPATFILWIIYDATGQLVDKYRKDHALTGKNDASISVRDSVRFGTSFCVVVIAFCLLIQGFGFHMKFALQDGVEGQLRDSRIKGYTRTAYINTTSSNAANLQGLMDFFDDYCDESEEVILYGNVPGLGYLLGKGSALTTFWPDLDSFTYDEWTRDLGEIRKEVLSGMPAPFIVTSIQTAAWIGQSDEAISFFGIDVDKFGSDRKLADLTRFIEECGYMQIYCNDGYSVYYVRDICDKMD